MSDTRRKDLAKIHIAKKDLDMDDDTYRAMLWTVARVRSSADLDMHARQKVLQYLRSIGFRSRQPAGGYPGRPKNTDAEPQLRKIEALLTDMNLPWSYADSIAQQIFKIQKVGWLRSDQWQAVIASLSNKQKAMRDD